MAKRKKSVKKRVTKNKASKRAGGLRKRKTLRRAQGRTKNQFQNEDIIFDSSIGKTDALFVSSPDNQQEINNLMVELEVRLSAKEKAGFQKQINGETPVNNVNPPGVDSVSPKVLIKRKDAFSWRKFFLLE